MHLINIQSEFQEDTACTRLEFCRDLQRSAQIVSTQSGGPIPFFGQVADAPCRLAGSAPPKSGGCRAKSWPDLTHKQTHSSHLDL